MLRSKGWGHFDFLEPVKLCTEMSKKNDVILILCSLKFMKVQSSHLSVHLNNLSQVSCSKDLIIFSIAASSSPFVLHGSAADHSYSLKFMINCS